MALLFANNASGTLSTTLTVGSTSAVLQSGEGALFPTPTGGDTFYATLEDTSGNTEIVSVTARSSDTFTIVRAQEGTSDQEFASGSRFEIRVTAATLNALLQSAAASATYAPLTHFNPDSTNAQLLDNGNVAVETATAGAVVRRSTGTDTELTLADDLGSAAAKVLTDNNDDLVVTNEVASGRVFLKGRSSTSTPTSVFFGDPDTYAQMYYAGEAKVRAESHGLRIFGANENEPYNTSIYM